MDVHSVTTMFAALLVVAVMGGTAAMLRLPAPPTREPPFRQLKHWLLQPVRAAAVAVCRTVLSATCQPPSWLPSRETLCMLCLLEGPMHSIGFHGSAAELWPGASWLVSAFLAALFRRYLRISYFALQVFAGELARRGHRSAGSVGRAYANQVWVPGACGQACRCAACQWHHLIPFVLALQAF